MELRHLRYFVTVAEEGHFRRAAERLHMTQPPLSQQIRDLEAELGVVLFERTTRQVSLTPAGEAFLRQTRSILAAVDQAAREAQQIERGERGHLTLGFVGSAAYHLLPHLLRQLRSELPDVRLTLLERPTASLVDDLISGSIDLALARPGRNLPGLHRQSLLTETLVVVLPAGHPLVQHDSIDPAELAGEAFVHFPPQLGEGLYQQIDTALAATGLRPNVVQEAIQMPTILGLVASGLGIAVLPASVASLRLSGVVFRDLAAPDVRVSIDLLWREGAPSTLLQRWLAICQSTQVAI
ncbi:MAG: LysR family transcriptional regulator [Chloroflexi bacterium]|nr:LysR family transcriptional regulator [Chloroflexota bacterium]